MTNAVPGSRVPHQRSETNRFRKLLQFLNTQGPSWTSLYVLYALCYRLVQYLEARLFLMERRKYITGHSTISARRNTIAENKRVWDDYDWSQSGDEWTLDAKFNKGLDPEQWKTALLNEMMFKYIQRDSTVLEIGPGAGRWTQFLVPISRRLLLADISERCLSLCRERFKSYPDIEFYLVTEENGLDAIGADNIDYVWSYDVFVHINPTDTEQYVAQFGRILKPGGCAIIHHAGAGAYGSEDAARELFRSNVSGDFFAHLVRKHGMELVEQNASLPHLEGDLITVFRKPPIRRSP